MELSEVGRRLDNWARRVGETGLEEFIVSLREEISAGASDPDLLAPGGRFVLVEGRWGTGAGFHADSLRALVAPLMSHVDVVPLSDPTLWGKEIDDERYALVAQP